MDQAERSRRGVAVIGGGLAGLATACQLRLLQPERPVCLFEASDRLGGVIHTETVDDLVIDWGADMFSTQPAAAVDLITALGGGDRLITPRREGRGAMVVCRGKLVPIPAGFVLMRATQLRSMLTTPLLSPAGKLRLLAEYFIRQPAGDGDESVASFVRRRLGDEMLQRIVGPLIAGIYTADVERLSMRATMGPLLQMVRQHGSLAAATIHRRRTGQDDVEAASNGARYEQFRGFDGGMIQLIRLLADSLPAASIRTGCPVTRITRLECGSFGLDTPASARGDASGTAAAFGDVVLATPPRVAASLLDDWSPAAAAQLRQIRSASAAIVVLVVRRDQIAWGGRTFGFIVPPIEGRRILAASFASEKFDGRAPADQVIIRTFVGGMLQSDLLGNDDPALVDLVRTELGELIGLSGPPRLTRVVRWNDAMPQYEVGHLDRVATIKQAIRSIPGLHLVSNCMDGVGIAPLIAAAAACARRIVDPDPDDRACG